MRYLSPFETTAIKTGFEFAMVTMANHDIPHAQKRDKALLYGILSVACLMPEPERKHLHLRAAIKQCSSISSSPVSQEEITEIRNELRNHSSNVNQQIANLMKKVLQ